MTETNSTWKCCYGICQCTIEDMKETRNTFYLEELKEKLDELRPFLCVRKILTTGTDKEVKEKECKELISCLRKRSNNLLSDIRIDGDDQIFMVTIPFGNSCIYIHVDSYYILSLTIGNSILDDYFEIKLYLSEDSFKKLSLELYALYTNFQLVNMMDVILDHLLIMKKKKNDYIASSIN